MTTTTEWLLAAWCSRSRRPVRRFLRHAPADDRGEGVISVAIAVLIMAFLGAAMWVGFQSMWETTSSKTSDQVDQIGGP